MVHPGPLNRSVDTPSNTGWSNPLGKEIIETFTVEDEVFWEFESLPQKSRETVISRLNTIGREKPQGLGKKLFMKIAQTLPLEDFAYSLKFFTNLDEEVANILLKSEMTDAIAYALPAFKEGSLTDQIAYAILTDPIMGETGARYLDPRLGKFKALTKKTYDTLIDLPGGGYHSSQYITAFVAEAHPRIAEVQIKRWGEERVIDNLANFEVAHKDIVTRLIQSQRWDFLGKNMKTFSVDYKWAAEEMIHAGLGRFVVQYQDNFVGVLPAFIAVKKAAYDLKQAQELLEMQERRAQEEEAREQKE